MKLTDTKLEGFVAEVASVSPAPGGGSVAALSGTLAAALTSMVANNALKKKKVDRQAVKELLDELLPLRESLLAAVDADTDAFNLVMKALALPKDPPDVRQRALVHATKQATRVPLQVVEHCALLTDIMVKVTAHARKSLASDLGVGVETLACAVQGAAYNVLINLPGLSDAPFVADTHRRLEKAQATARDNLEVVREWVEKRLS